MNILKRIQGRLAGDGAVVRQTGEAGGLNSNCKPVADSQLPATLPSAPRTSQALDGRNEEEPAQGSPTVGHFQASILVVDDDPLSQEFASAALMGFGCDVDVVQNGEEAVEALAHSYDMILMDCLMPVMDGYEATRRIRKMERSRGSHVPIIAVTGHSMKGDRRQCLDAGMDDYLSKPFGLNELEAILNRWLSPSRSERPHSAEKPQKYWPWKGLGR